MSSWTDKELELLCDPDNHKITSDGFGFRWYHKIKGYWEVHSIKVFENYAVPHSWVIFHMYRWSDELSSRRHKRIRSESRVFRKIQRICRSSEIANRARVMAIHRLNPQLNQKEISLLLKISQPTVYRYLK